MTMTITTVKQAARRLTDYGWEVTLPGKRRDGVYRIEGCGSGVVHNGNRAGFIAFANKL